MARLDRALALDRGGRDRFVSWSIALKAFFATLALAGVMALDHAVARWQSGDYAVVTVQLPAESAPELREAAAEAMRRAPGVDAAEPIPEAEVAALLGPWLGGEILPVDLPLPAMIDIRVAPGRVVDWPAAEARLREVSPDAVLDTGAAWVDGLVRVARAAQGLMGAALAFVAVIAAFAVVFATRAGLTAHRDVIELVHWLGARDRDVARAFERRAFSLGLRGGVAGAVAAAGVLFALVHAARRLETPLLLELALPALSWWVFAAAPAAAAVIAAAAARRTVMAALARML